MFEKYRKPAEFDRITALAQRLKDLQVWRQIFLSYSHNDQTYRLTYSEWSMGPTEQALPVFEDRGFLPGELTDKLRRDIGLLELEWRQHREEMACQRYQSEDCEDFLDAMAAPGDQAFINALVRQVQL